MITSTRPCLTTWGEVIGSLAELHPDDIVCFGGGPHSPDDPCLIVDTVHNMSTRSGTCGHTSNAARATSPSEGLTT